MKCPTCDAENPDTRKFCRECGSKFLLICPKCEAENFPSDKFCGECGQNLAASPTSPRELSFDEKIQKIQKYLPANIIQKILSQRDKIEGERKLVTVMFCDMRGFTPLSERLGPEAMYALMDRVYEILIHKVQDYDGTVNEMTGDGIMALFGAPIALEDAPQRAIRSAIAIHREMTRFNEKLKKEKGFLPTLEMRIGINTGPVVVGTLGNDLRVEFKAVGDTVNLAARMEQSAEPGTTYVTENTFKLAEGLFRFEALGEKQIKGKENRIKVYQVISASTRRTRFDVSAEKGLTCFVGRERELELLLDGYERSKSGRGQAVSIIADAGIGKSRLLYEFRKAVANEFVTFLEGRCLSYSRNVAYHPVVDVLKANFEIQDNDTDEDIRKKVIRGLDILKMDESQALPYLLEILSVRDSGVDKIRMSPEAKKDGTIEALKRIMLKGSERRPVIMAIEDLHWIDRSSEDVFKDLLGSISGSRVLLVFTYRPQFVHTWGSRSYHSQVTLNRLSNRESLAMLSYLLKTEDVDKNLQEIVLEKTEGIPFFIEEFIKSLKDLRIIECRNGSFEIIQDLKAAAIPSTIHDIIMSRVDVLPDVTRELLRSASAIEREFSHEMIKKLTALPEQTLLSNLSILKDSELLFERGIYPHSHYIFKHALTREVVYNSILDEKKKKLHEEIGKAVEELYKENLSEYYEVLAEHSFLSENYPKAAEYSRLAGRKAEKSASFIDAIAHANRRVESLERLNRTDEIDKQIIDARTLLGLYKAQMHYFVEAKEAIDPILDLAVKHDYKKRLCQIYTFLGPYYACIEENYPAAFKSFEDALRIAGEIKDIIATVLASTWYGVALGWQCDFEKAIRCHQRALDFNMAAKNLSGIAIMKSNLGWSGYYYAGRTDLSYEITQDAARVADESGDIFSKPMPYTLHGISSYGKGLFNEAEKFLLMGGEACEKINVHSYNGFAQTYLGEIYFLAGDYLKSKECYQKGIDAWERLRWMEWASLAKVGLARSKISNKQTDVDIESLYVHARNSNIKANEGLIRKNIGEILLNMDDEHLSYAKYWIEQAIDADQRNRMMFHLGQDHAIYADFFKKKDNKLGAKEQLTRAIDIFKECGADGWVTRTEKSLTEIR